MPYTKETFMEELGRMAFRVAADYYLPKEKPKMKLEDAMLLARHGQALSHQSPVRQKVIQEARDICKARAEELMQAAEKKAKAEADRVLVDIQTYGDSEMRNYDKRWVKRTFSDGSVTKVREPRQYAEQLKYTFEQGKKAARVVDLVQQGREAFKDCV